MDEDSGVDTGEAPKARLPVEGRLDAPALKVKGEDAKGLGPKGRGVRDGELVDVDRAAVETSPKDPCTDDEGVKDGEKERADGSLEQPVAVHLSLDPVTFPHTPQMYLALGGNKQVVQPPTRLQAVHGALKL